ncbi:hypothetical protein [Longispora urticae]
MAQRDLDYRDIGASLRPPRFALAYRVYDDWVFEARRANAVLAGVWGGVGDVLIPVATDSCTATASLLPFLRRFDPDYVGGHLRTLGDFDGNAAIKAAIIAKAAYPDESPEETWSRIRPVRHTNDGSWEGLAEQVDAWCSPYRGPRQGRTEFRQQNLDWPARDKKSRRTLLSVPTDPATRVVVFDLSDIDPRIGLMVETRIGAADEPAGDGGAIVRIPVRESDLPKIVALAITGTTRWNLAEHYGQAVGEPAGEGSPPIAASDLLTDSPYAHAGAWAKKVTHGYEEPPVVCVIGDEPEDHALAVLADRLFKHGAWVPRSVLDGELSEAVKTAIHRLGELPEDHDTPVYVTSMSEDLANIEALATEINGRFEMRSVPDGAVIRTGSLLRSVAPADLLRTRSVCGLADPTAFSIRRTLPVAVDGPEIVTLAPLQLPLPEVAQAVGVDVHWQIDVFPPGFQAPARTAIPSKTFLPAAVGSFPDAVFRAARSGISFASPNMGITFSGDPIEARLAQPQLRLPGSDELFSEIAARAGARIERSDAGRRAQNALDMWGSFDRIAADLTGTTRQVLNAFLPPERKKNGDYGVGYAIRSEGFVSLEDIVDKFDLSATEGRDLLDRLLLIKVVRRGYILKCARCRWEAFYPIEHVGPTFPCQSCLHVSDLTRGQWYEADLEPHIYYALDQVVRNLLNQHGYLPILAAAQLGKGARSVLWSSEFSVIDDKDSIELDICLIVDGSIIVGEAKSNGTLRADHGTQEAAQRLVRAAQILTADQIVLATSRADWARDTYELVAKAIDSTWLRGPKPQLIELAGVGTDN